MNAIPDYLRTFAEETGAVITIIDPEDVHPWLGYIVSCMGIIVIICCCAGFGVYLHFFG
jgi:hypothetical protein